VVCNHARKDSAASHHLLESSGRPWKILLPNQSPRALSLMYSDSRRRSLSRFTARNARYCCGPRIYDVTRTKLSCNADDDERLFRARCCVGVEQRGRLWTCKQSCRLGYPSRQGPPFNKYKRARLELSPNTFVYYVSLKFPNISACSYRLNAMRMSVAIENEL
jgi:hypothetical protein